MRTMGERTGSQNEFYNRLGDKIKNDIRVGMPGIVQSFDPVEQTVTVQPSIRERIRNPDGSVEFIALPLLLDVPVVFPRAGGFVLTMPISPGDECLVIFADSCIDAWWSNGDVQNWIEKRRHDLSDGFAIMGTWSQPRRVANYSTEAAQLRTEDGLTFISLKPGEIDLNASITSILSPGKGIRFTSPDGTVSKTLTINNDGTPVWS